MDNIVMCYHEKMSPYWSRLWVKAALLTGRQNMSWRQYFIHLACSLHHHEPVFSWAVYNNTRALYFPQINGNVRGGPHKMDARSRLTYRLLKRDTQTKTMETDPFTEVNLSLLPWNRSVYWVCFLSLFSVLDVETFLLISFCNQACILLS